MKFTFVVAVSMIFIFQVTELYSKVECFCKFQISDAQKNFYLKSSSPVCSLSTEIHFTPCVCQILLQFIVGHLRCIS